MNVTSARYRPIAFVAIAFSITWACAFFMAYQPWLGYNSPAGAAVLTALDFLESASPLVAALLLLPRPRALTRFFLGGRPRLLPYLTVALLFVWQFLTFSLFSEGGPLPLWPFAAAWAGQILLGGGMEEGGWRGYLQPALEKRVPVPAAVILVSLVWAFWHLPYFFLPNTFQSGGNFLFYLVTTTATAFTLTAIHKMTGSVLLCTLFHGWQNAIVMTLPADMAHPGFLVMVALQTAVSVVLCVRPIGGK